MNPKGFVDGVFSLETLFRLDPIDKPLEAYAVSVSSLGHFQNENSAHEYGWRATEAKIAGIEQREGAAMAPDDRLRYLGHYQLNYGWLLRKHWDFHNVSFRCCPDGGLREHCHIEIQWNGIAGPKAERKRERLDIQIWLAEWCYGPTRHVAPADQFMAEKLNAIDLPIRTRRDAAA